MKLWTLRPSFTCLLLIFSPFANAGEASADYVEISEIKNAPSWFNEEDLRFFLIKKSSPTGKELMLTAKGLAFFKVHLTIKKGDVIIIDDVVTKRILPGETQFIDLSKEQSKQLFETNGIAVISRLSAVGK